MFILTCTAEWFQTKHLCNSSGKSKIFDHGKLTGSIPRAVYRNLFQPRQIPSRPLPSPFPSLSLPSPFPSLSLPSPFPPLLPSPFLSLPSLSFPGPLPPGGPTPVIQLRGLGERCELPQRVRAEPGRQAVSGAFCAKKSTSGYSKIRDFSSETTC